MVKLPVHIQFRGTESSEALEASAVEHARKLEALADDIMSCRVSIELGQKHQQQGRPFSVRIDLTLPDHELVTDRVQRDDVYVALRDAFDSMKRQLAETVQRRRGQEKHHATPLHGEVVRLDTAGGFGFIRTPEGDEYYFSRDNLVGLPFEHLQAGQPVQFMADPAAPRPQARRVSVGRHGTGESSA